MAAHLFDDLVQSIAIAIMHGVRVAEQQHQFLMGEYFEESRDETKTLTPKTRKVRVPSSTVIRDNADAYEILEVPLITLVPLQSMKVEKVSVSFKAVLKDLNTQEESPLKDISVLQGKARRSQLSLELTGGTKFRKQNEVEVEIVMSGTDPPEGIVRLNDKLLKDIDLTPNVGG